MGQMSKAIGVILTIGISAGAMVFAGGCADSPAPAKTAAVRSDVTDVRPMEAVAPAAYQPPMIDNSSGIPTAPQMVTTDTPITSATPMMSTTPTAQLIGEKTHTVRHGETLFSIAKASYGSGKAWKKIAAANPGIAPSKLKVGQVLAMP